VLAGFARRLADSPSDAIVLVVTLELIHRHGLDPDELVRRSLDVGYRLFRPTAFGRLKEFEPDLPGVSIPHATSCAGARAPRLARPLSSGEPDLLHRRGCPTRTTGSRSRIETDRASGTPVVALID
jgi:hypothetical protein